MAIRIMGYSVNEKKNLFIALTAIFGIGITTAKKICIALEIDPLLRASELSAKQIHTLTNYIGNNFVVGDDLKKEKHEAARNLVDINCYRGNRLKKGLPCRGQRTRCNAKTARKIKHV